MKNKKTHKQFVKWLEDKTAIYRHLLSLNAWSVQVTQKVVRKDIKGVCLSIDFAGYGYLKAYLDWTELAFEKWEQNEIQTLERSVIHELIHVLLVNYNAQATDRYTMEIDLKAAEETVCDHIAHVIHRIVKGWKPDGV